ncbi:hypothetical protein QYE76_044269 [Lolium multiflorum]|uniref:MATH domain-containing protein n=1 Tax=Lolium multiflorum TaxID=4521 RepID=A0AAD8TIY9_LOLMU|nr:hypothetical protein QYE76_044269 [Lolium multiflorum]
MKGVAHTNMFDSGFVSFKLHYSEAKDLAIGDLVSSDVFSAGGHSWRVKCYPRGCSEADKVEHIVIFLELMSKSNGVKAIFDVFFMDKNSEPSPCHARRSVHVYPPKGYTDWGWPSFITRTELRALYVVNGWATILCGVIVVRDDPLAVPSSDIGDHLGQLLDGADGSDVSFIVDGKKFAACKL